MYAALRLEAELFLLAVGHLTSLQGPRRGPVSDDLLIRSVKYQPVVGAGLGALGALVLWIGELVLPPVAAVVLALAGMMLVTAAFDEKGLATTVDALAEGGPPSVCLARMDAQAFGAAGCLSLISLFALNVSLLASQPVATAGCLLIAGQAVGRMAAAHVTATTHHVRRDGIGQFVPAITRDGYRVGLAFTCLGLIPLVLVAGWIPAAVGFAGAVFLAQGFLKFIRFRLGGYTGACLGGTHQLAALGMLLGAVAALG